MQLEPLQHSKLILLNAHRSSHRHPNRRLQAARLERHWTQAEVAERLGTTEVSVGRWEQGKSRPVPYFRRLLCQLFGKSEQELGLSWEGGSLLPASTSTAPLAFFDSAVPSPLAGPLVGRDALLVSLKAHLLAPRYVALAALSGPPGVGKTALAIALAYDPEVQARFQDGVLWAGLGPQPNLLGALARWGTLLGLSRSEMASLSSGEAWAQSLHAVIGSLRLLLVLDDVWQIEHAQALRLGGPYCAYLLTTRFPAVGARFANSGGIQVEELDEEEGLALLAQLAPRAVEMERQAAREVVRAVGGLPLALTLLGEHFRAQAATGQVRRLRAAFERALVPQERQQLSQPQLPLDMHPSLPTGMPLSLQAIITASTQVLAVQTQSALGALCLFPPKPNSFSEQAAVTVAACSPEVLDALCDAGLLDSSGDGRYTMHRTIVDYGRLQGIDHTAEERYVQFWTAFVEANRGNYMALAEDTANILAALETAYRLSHGTALWRAVRAMTDFLEMRGLYDTAVLHLARAQQVAAGAGDADASADFLLQLERVAQQRREHAQTDPAHTAVGR